MESVSEVSGYVYPNSDLVSNGTSNEVDKYKNVKNRKSNKETNDEDSDDSIKLSKGNNTGGRLKKDIQDIIERSKYIPMRLTVDERRHLRVLENALEVSDYTDKVDVFNRKTKYNRIIDGLVDVLSASCGLMVANDLSHGERYMLDRELHLNLPLFRDMFEIARRYKIMNPTKLRNTYGKMMCILQDSQINTVRHETNICLVKDILMVYSFLEERDSLAILTDTLLGVATQSLDHHTITTTPVAAAAAAGGGSGVEDKLKREYILEAREAAVKTLCETYSSDRLSCADILRVINSIADNNAYITSNIEPILTMIQHLQTNFHPKQPTNDFSLSLTGRSSSSSSSYKKSSSGFSGLMGYGSSGFSSRLLGSGDACLHHDHPTQFTFVLQTLCLWKEIMGCLPKLWIAADKDMLQQQYRLADTGQGLHRMQSCPEVRHVMNRILEKVQRETGSAWVGLSVVHLGDRDVPNALVFIDKYCQVPRILAPIAACIDKLPELVHDLSFHAYVQHEWGSIDGLRLQILSDFFKHGFDGSGDDGGSCIDGRLTSAWNWCSKLMKKPYYYVFMFTGFQGFDGDWKD